MLLGLLLSILTATYNVSSTTTVDAIGDIPDGSTYQYERSATTGQKGQMTAGNSTTLYLNGWHNCQIQSIALQMRSNTDSGAGALHVTMDDIPVWIIDNAKFSESYWAGAYSTDWVEIKKHFTRTTSNSIKIHISASTNSLYIDSYSISYTTAPPTCYTVDFQTGLDSHPMAVTQNQIGEPIILPHWQDTALWHFVGWSEKEIEEEALAADIYPAGSSYTPKHNSTLWAVYSDGEAIASTTTYQSGEYIISAYNTFTETIAGSGLALNGKISNKYIPLCKVEIRPNQEGEYSLYSPITDDMIYLLDFTPDSTLYITHYNSGTPIGHSENKLAKNAKEWCYKLLNDNSLEISYAYKNHSYSLYFGIPNMSDEAVAYVQSLDVEKWEKDGMYLFPVSHLTFTSWPFGKYDALEEIYHPEQEGMVIHLGTYILYIKHGKKYMHIRE